MNIRHFLCAVCVVTAMCADVLVGTGLHFKHVNSVVA